MIESFSKNVAIVSTNMCGVGGCGDTESVLLLIPSNLLNYETKLFNTTTTANEGITTNNNNNDTSKNTVQQQEQYNDNVVPDVMEQHRSMTIDDNQQQDKIVNSNNRTGSNQESTKGDATRVSSANQQETTASSLPTPFQALKASFLKVQSMFPSSPLVVETTNTSSKSDDPKIQHPSKNEEREEVTTGTTTIAQSKAQPTKRVTIEKSVSVQNHGEYKPIQSGQQEQHQQQEVQPVLPESVLRRSQNHTRTSRRHQQEKKEKEAAAQLESIMNRKDDDENEVSTCTGTYSTFLLSPPAIFKAKIRQRIAQQKRENEYQRKMNTMVAATSSHHHHSHDRDSKRSSNNNNNNNDRARVKSTEIKPKSNSTLEEVVLLQKPKVVTYNDTNIFSSWFGMCQPKNQKTLMVQPIGYNKKRSSTKAKHGFVEPPHVETRETSNTMLIHDRRVDTPSIHQQPPSPKSKQTAVVDTPVHDQKVPMVIGTSTPSHHHRRTISSMGWFDDAQHSVKGQARHDDNVTGSTRIGNYDKYETEEIIVATNNEDDDYSNNDDDNDIRDEANQFSPNSLVQPNRQLSTILSTGSPQSYQSTNHPKYHPPILKNKKKNIKGTDDCPTTDVIVTPSTTATSSISSRTNSMSSNNSNSGVVGMQRVATIKCTNGSSSKAGSTISTIQQKECNQRQHHQQIDRSRKLHHEENQSNSNRSHQSLWIQNFAPAHFDPILRTRSV